MNYEELVKALRIHASVDIECYECAYYDDCCINGNGHTKMMTDAAAAIEALQAEVKRLKAENPIVETVLVDKMRQQMEETVCHCNVKENAELIAKILDDDVDRKVFELPKRGDLVEVVRCRECRWGHLCVMGQHLGLDGFCSKGEREVQDGV